MIGCGKGSGGTQVEFIFGEQKLSYTVAETGGFQAFVPTALGTVQIPAAGQQRVERLVDRVALLFEPSVEVKRGLVPRSGARGGSRHGVVVENARRSGKEDLLCRRAGRCYAGAS